MTVTRPSIENVQSAILNLWGNGVHSAPDARQRGKERAAIISDNLATLLPILDTNTVSTDLKRTVILQQYVRAFAIRALPLLAFSTKFDGVRLEGTDKVLVPYFPLNTTASNDWNPANGYDSFANSNSDGKLITVDKRKWQGLKFTSSELARQPYMNIAQGIVLVAEQLCLDVVNDILSLIKAADFGTAGFIGAASGFDEDDVVDLHGKANDANWPLPGRSLVLNSAYDVSLLKSQNIKLANQFGDNGPITEGRIARIVNFDYYPDSRVPGNSENLEGFITWKSALLVAFAPIGPTAEVRQQLLRYEVLVEPTSNVTLEYRAFGDAILDTAKQTVEANYGRLVGETAALKRITSV